MPSMDWSLSLKDVSDKQLRAALSQTNVPALLASLSHLDGSSRQFRVGITPHVVPLAEEEDGLSEEERVAARALAFDRLQAYRDASCPDPEKLSDAGVEEAMHFITGEKIPAEQMAMMSEELNLYGEDRRRLNIEAGSVPEEYRVLVIGSGMSGILAAVRLKEAGIPFDVVDKNPEIGGTWFLNTYPGCQVDSANHLYNYIFAPESQWPGHFSGQSELLEYFLRVVEEFRLRDDIQLETEVLSALWHENTAEWEVCSRDSDGKESTSRYDSIVSACGQLNLPAFPDIPGRESFAGIAFHSARWNHQTDLSGKRVAVIGTGCSAVQFVPEIADKTIKLEVFQRSAPWLLPAEEYHLAMTEAELWCFRNLPFYARWYRFYLFRSRGVDGLLPFFFTQKNWNGHSHSVSADNAALRDALIESIREQAGGDKALAAALIPDYPPGGKRPVLDDGQWIDTLKKPHVTLQNQPIRAIEAEGIRTEDGAFHDFDVVIYATGFKADHFLQPIKITGREGRDLHDTWQGNPQAYLGITVPGFPNFYCLYGPNTNIVTGSSIIFGSECEMRYIMGCLKFQFENDVKALEVREDICRDYNVLIDTRSRECAWGSEHVDSWYKNSEGRVSQNWPGTHWEWWQQTRTPDPGDFHIV